MIPACHLRLGIVAAFASCLALGVAAEPFCASTRIVGGENAAPNSWPSQAAVVRKHGDETALCGGTVIQSRWVLTAAHCVFEDSEGTKPAAAGDFRVIVNTTDLTNKSNGGVALAVRQLLAKPGYHGATHGLDVALLELERPAPVPAIGLVPEELAAKLAPPGTSAVAVGWGTTSTGGDASVSQLLQVEVPIVDAEACGKHYPGLVASQICAGVREGGKDTCQGDSGGPLMVRDAGGKYVQVGIVSYGKGCGVAGIPGVYEQTGPHLGWIRQYVRDIAVAGEPDSSTGGDAGVGPAADDVLGGGDDGRIRLAILPQSSVKLGSTIQIRIESEMSGNLLVIDARDGGELVQLFPNSFTAPYVGNTIAAGKPRIVPGNGDGFEFTADTVGNGRIGAIVSQSTVRIDGLAQRHLDLRPIGDARAYLGALCDGLRSVGAEHAGDWISAKEAYRIVQ
jgi:secreted trypsin-like serine protease